MKICGICRKTKNIEEFPYLWRRQIYTYKGRKEVKNLLRNSDNPSFLALVCNNCLEDEYIIYLRKCYLRLGKRNKKVFKTALNFSFTEFYDWIKNTEFQYLYKKYRIERDKTPDLDPPSIDRINAWMEYSLVNMQVLSRNENCSKGNSPALGAKRITMRFFKKLREEKGLSKYQMANFLGILPSSYYYLEDEARGCSFEVLMLIKRKLNITWDKLGKMIDEEYGDLPGYEIVEVVRKKRGRPRKKN